MHQRTFSEVARSSACVVLSAASMAGLAWGLLPAGVPEDARDQAA